MQEILKSMDIKDDRKTTNQEGVVPPLLAIKKGGLQVELNSVDPNPNSNFFSNYYTPKSAIIQ